VGINQHKFFQGRAFPLVAVEGEGWNVFSNEDANAAGIGGPPWNVTRCPWAATLKEIKPSLCCTSITLLWATLQWL